jgi:hypothetical protein
MTYVYFAQLLEGWANNRSDMMKHRYSLVFLTLVLVAIMAAGCTTPKPGGQATAPAGTAAPSGLTTLGSAIDMSKIKWYEYVITVSSPDVGSTHMKMRMDYGVTYNGQAADKCTMSSDITQDGQTITTVTESYVDKAGNSLGGHIKAMQGGQVLYEMDVPASSGGGGTSSVENPLSTNSGAALTGVGSETVTVPAGTYACTKYAWSASGGSGTIWVSSSVPLPVKVDTRVSGGTMTMELNGWG